MPSAPTRSSQRPDISIRQLEYLVAVADSPTWAAAATSVGVSASALSQGLAELERRVGAALFESVGRRRILRRGASEVLDHARQVVALTDDLVAWSRRRRDAESGEVRLGMIDVAAVVHFPEVLRAFRSERPDVDLRLTVAPSRALFEQLERGDLDLVIGIEGDRLRSGIATVSLLSESLVVYGPPGIEIGRPASWGPWVLFPPGSHTRRLLERALLDCGATIDVAAESHQPDVIREMVLLGLGWTVLPRSQADDALTVGPQLLERELVLASRESATTDPAVDELADRLTAR